MGAATAEVPALVEATSESGVTYRWRLGEGLQQGETTDAVVIFSPRASRAGIKGALLDELSGVLVLMPEGVKHEEKKAGEVSPSDISMAAAERLITEMAERERKGKWADIEQPPEFDCEMRDALAARGYLLEMGREYGVRRFFLVGVGEGAGFATLFAARFPALADGLVLVDVERCELAGTGEHGGGILQIPIVMTTTAGGKRGHETALLRAAYAENGHEMVRVCRVDGGDGSEKTAAEMADAVRRGVAWCDAMTRRGEGAADDVLSLSRGLADDPRWLGAARRSLERLLPKKEEEDESASDGAVMMDLSGVAIGKPGDMLDDVSEKVRGRAEEMIGLIDEQALRHVWTLRGGCADVKMFVLDGSAWLGHVAAIREEWRGVPLVERYLHECGYAAMVDAHNEAAAEMWEVWDGEAAGSVKDEGAFFRRATAAFGGCYASEYLPRDCEERLRGMYARREALGLDGEALEQFERVTLYAESMEKGRGYTAEVNTAWDVEGSVLGLVDPEENVWPLAGADAEEAGSESEETMGSEAADAEEKSASEKKAAPEEMEESDGVKW